MSEVTQGTVLPASRRTRQPPPEIVLIGSSIVFSDSLIRATAQSLRDRGLIHLPSMAAFNALHGDDSKWLRLIVVDDATVRNSTPEDLARFCAPPSSIVVMAFHDLETAANCYHAPEKCLPIDSYVPLDVRLDVWLSVLKLLLHGGRYIPEELQAPPQTSGPAPSHMANIRATLGLTPRQYDVLELVSEGLPNKLIAARLGVSDHTVKLHIHNIIGKLGVSNRTEAAARFHDGLP